jgi:hypothetical protein
VYLFFLDTLEENNFYDWTVTSAVEKALMKGEVTFRVTGFALNAKGFNGGVKLLMLQHWEATTPQ